MSSKRRTEYRPPRTTLPARGHRRPYVIQWERMLRWRERSGAAIQGVPDAEPFDVLIALFGSIFDMRDWLANSNPHTATQVRALFASSPPLLLVRDLANGAKHMTLTRYKVDGSASVLRQYEGRDRPPSYVVFDERQRSGNIAALDLADEAIGELRRFMAASGFHVD